MRILFMALLAATVLAACSTGRPPGPTQPETAATAGTEAAATEAAPVTLPTATPAAEPAATDAAATTEPAATEAASPAAAIPDLANVKIALTPVAEGLDQPLFVTYAPDDSGRIFIVEKVGRVRILQDGSVLPTPFLDISDQVSLSSEQGLLGLAFAPDYATSGRFFVNYTNQNGDTVVSRFTVSADPNVADSASELPILQIDQPAPNHNGGMLTFGPDGMLWIGTGDGGAANDRFGNGQNPATLLGKMLRINVNTDPDEPYAIPADNPWVTADWNGQDVRNEIWAVGLRNPWRYSFDRQTGDLWIADVGQNQIEEVNVIPAGSQGGLNFGWPIMEGKRCFQQENCDQTGLVIPVLDYPHQGDCSVTGGYVYRGQQIPAWNGVYFFGDYCSGKIWALAPDGQGGWNNALLTQERIQLSSFGDDAAGELYVTDLAGGTVYRMTQP